MRKAIKYIFLGFTVCSLLFLVLSCGKDKTDTDDTKTDDDTTETTDITGVTLSDATYEYDGAAHTITVSGDLPSGVSVVYVYKNSASTVVTSCIDADEYSVEATLSGDSYNTLVLSATMTITKLSFSEITLADVTAEYDGSAHDVEISGDLPSGAAVEYSYVDSDGNTVSSPVEAGEYTATAVVSMANYNTLTLTATVTISKKSITSYTFEDSTVTYDGSTHTIEATDLEDGVSASYVITDSDGNTVDEALHAGTYTVTATLSGTSYETLTVSKTLTIEKAYYTATAADINFVEILDLVYNGECQAIDASSLNLPANVTGTIKYYSNGSIIDTSTVVNPGEYQMELWLESDDYIFDATVNNEVYAVVEFIYDDEITHDDTDGDGDNGEYVTLGYAYLAQKSFNIAKATMSDDVAQSVSVEFDGTARTYDTSYLSSDYSATINGYYSDEDCTTGVTPIAKGTYYVSLTITSDLYNSKDFVTTLVVEGGKCQVTFVYVIDPDAVVGVYPLGNGGTVGYVEAVTSGDVVTSELLGTYDDTADEPVSTIEEGTIVWWIYNYGNLNVTNYNWEYSWDYTDGTPVTSDLVITINCFPF